MVEHVRRISRQYEHGVRGMTGLYLTNSLRLDDENYKLLFLDCLNYAILYAYTYERDMVELSNEGNTRDDLRSNCHVVNIPRIDLVYL
jgi:hypothetical protein